MSNPTVALDTYDAHGSTWVNWTPQGSTTALALCVACNHAYLHPQVHRVTRSVAVLDVQRVEDQFMVARLAPELRRPVVSPSLDWCGDAPTEA